MSSPVANPLALATLYGHADLELILVRHGQQIPPDERTQEQRNDPPLSRIGESQIEAVGEHLRSESITAVYSSNLERAHRTGLAIAARHSLPVTVMDDLREIDILQAVPAGETWAEMNARPEWEAAGEAFVETGRWSSFPSSEPSDVFRDRVQASVDQIVSDHPEGRVVVACHGGVINAVVATMLGIDRDFWFRPAHCSVHRVLVGHGRRAVWNLNEIHHLSDELTTA